MSEDRADRSVARAHNRHRLVGVFALVVVIEVVGLCAYAAWILAGARRDLENARRHGQDGRQAVQALELERAERSFAAAADDFARGEAALGNAAVEVIMVLPVVGDDLRTVRALTAAGHRVSSSSADVLTFVNDAPGGLQAFLPADDRFQVERLQALARRTANAGHAVVDAGATVAATSDASLLGPVARARDEFADQLAVAEDLIQSAADASRAAAAMLGAEGRRRYLFGAQNPAELRGTGGYIGAYAVATFDDGRLRLGRFTPVQELTSLPVSDVPPPNADYADRYNRYGGAGFWPAINATPDFPSAAAAMVALYEATEDERLDGVVVVDPFVLRALMTLVGDVDVPRQGSVGPDEIVRVVTNDAYDDFDDPSRRKDVLGTAAAAALRRFLGGVDEQPRAILDALLPVLAGRHMLLYSTDVDVQAALERLHVAGALPPPDHDTVLVSVNNAAINKVDFYVRRDVDYRVRLRRDGTGVAQLRVTFVNRAPADGPRYVLGPSPALDLGVGDGLSLVSVFCGRCEPRSAEPALGDNVRTGTVIESELGHTVATTLLRVPRTGTRTATVRWRLRKAWDRRDGCYSLTYVDQPTLLSTRLRVSVDPPAGFVAASPGTGRTLHDGAVDGVLTKQACYRASDPS